MYIDENDHSVTDIALLPDNQFESVATLRRCILQTLSEDEELDLLTQQALEVVCAAILILLERQAEEQLPGGKYWQPSEAEQQKSQHVPTTNVVSERDFAVLNNLVRSKPNASSLSCEAYIMWLNNQTSMWLDNLDAEEKERHMAYARTHAASIHAKFLEKKQKIKEQRLEALLKKQKEKEDKKQKARQRKVALTEKVLKMGGVWKTAEEVDERVGSLNREQEKLEAVKNQLQFHKKVLNSEGNKELFQMTITRPGRGRHVFSCSEKISHLKEVISKNVTHSTDINSESEEEDEEREYVTLKEPEARTVQGIHETQNKKLQAETEKREVNRQKLSLPDYLKDPSKLVGCKIRQKFNTKDQDGNKVQTWYTGTVTEMMDGAQDPKDTEYLIVYDDENEKDEVYNLLSDLEKGELIVLNSD
ncbi:uncharacterized protein LOC118413793 [Branchiostoma floridae]|uniref:Uncharacterized protein LOC118413793 n=1 Tax=Branchiostoma floridae TaxID=7739 RepID=A0A9J7MMD7_BRAFL|nr:uncharacterized protein LOC118413793 [Branchiostoma floridae]